MDKPDALRLAELMDAKAAGQKSAVGDYWGDKWCAKAAAELRRLQIQNAELTENLERKSVAIQRIWKERDELRRQRSVLLEALERIADPRNTHFAGDAQVVARAAIKSVEEGK